jgi:tRNA dimethylallyltransferase
VSAWTIVFGGRMINLLAIVGPTASGKTALAVKLAKIYNGEVIAADSRTVYKYLDIGTAKPGEIEQSGVKHWGLDMAGPGETYTVADYQKYASDRIEDIKQRYRLAILVGGSGLYIDAVLYDFSLAPANHSLRRLLEALSIEQLQKKIVDNRLAMPANKLNRRHLVRTLERGKIQPEKQPLKDDVVIIGINPLKTELRKRIAARAQTMVELGVIKEIERAANLYGWESEAMTGGVYKVFKDVLTGQKSLEQAISDLITSDLHLAKKQLTWFRRNPDVHWFVDADTAFAWFENTYGGKL